MIRGTTTHTLFVCDKCRATEPGRPMPIWNTGRDTCAEPEGWEKRVVKKPSGHVFRHYCPNCQGDKR